MQKNKLIIAIPAYNEEDSIVRVISSIPESVSGVDQVQVLVVDDGSKDRTSELVRDKTKTEVISHGKNRGVGAAFRTAVDAAIRKRADILVTIDADGQFDVNDIPKLIEPIVKGEVDFVTGSRFLGAKDLPENMSKMKVWGNRRVAKMVNKLTGKSFSDVACGFRAYGKEALLNINLFADFTYTQEVILDLSFKRLRMMELPIGVKYFKGRKSKVARSLWRYGLNAMKINFSIFRDYKPLKFFGTLGLTIFIIGLILDIGVFIHFLATSSFTPYKYVIFTGGFLNILGIIILIVGFLAGMLARIRANQEKLLYFEKKKFYDGGK